MTIECSIKRIKGRLFETRTTIFDKKSGWINVEGTENGSKDHFVKIKQGEYVNYWKVHYIYILIYLTQTIRSL